MRYLEFNKVELITSNFRRVSPLDILAVLKVNVRLPVFVFRPQAAAASCRV